MEKMKYKRGVIAEESETEIDVIDIDKSRLKGIDGQNPRFEIDGSELYIAIRGDGEFRGKALYLSDDYDWVLCGDCLDAICLVPLKKEIK